VTSFIFKHFLALLAIFLILFSALIARNAGDLAPLLRASATALACRRQWVHKMTSVVGYYKSRGLSSEKCEER